MCVVVTDVNPNQFLTTLVTMLKSLCHPYSYYPSILLLNFQYWPDTLSP